MRFHKLAVLIAPLLMGILLSVGDPAQTQFYLEEALGYPHPTQAMVRVIPISTVTMRLRYGATRATMTSFDPDAAGTEVTGDTAGEFTMTSLSADTTYFYQLEASEDGTWKPRGIHEFKTPPTSTAATFMFTISSDTHFYGMWAQTKFGGQTCNLTQDLRQSGPYDDKEVFGVLAMREIAGQDQLFHVDLGDSMSDCQCSQCLDCDIWPDGSNGAFASSTDAATEAEEQTFCERRYRTAMKYLVPFEADTPFVIVDGNHDGGTYYGSLEGVGIGHYNGGAPGQPKRMFYTTRAARNKYLGNFNHVDWFPNTGCDGGCTEQDGDYSAFEVGSSLFIRITPYLHTPIGWGTDLDGDTVPGEDPDDFFPQNADQWTLGAEQLSWLENLLETTTKKWIFVLTHSLPGAPSPEFAGNYHYGKFGAGVERRCEDDGELCECSAGEFCFPPCATGLCEFPDLSKPWRGDLDVIFPAAATAADRLSGAVYFLLGHDHLTYSWQYTDGEEVHPVYVLMMGSTTLNNIANVSDGGAYAEQIGGLFGIRSGPLPPASDWIWEVPPYPKGLGTAARGWGKITVTGETSVKFQFIGGIRPRSVYYPVHPTRFQNKELVCLIYDHAGYSVCP